MAREMEGAAAAGGPEGVVMEGDLEGVVMEGDLEGAALMRARATAWELAALSFRYPGGDLAGAVASGEWLDAACEVACALGLALPEGFGEGLPGGMGADADAFGEGAEVGGAGAVGRALRVEATRLFVGAPDPVVSPYEGVHRAAADGVQPLLFVNPHSMDVERFMRSCGLGRPEGTNEPLDHVATECELMEVLSLCAASEAVPLGGDTTADEFPGGSPEAAYREFMAEHIRAWVPGFAQAVIHEARHPFYRAAAQYLSVLVEVFGEVF